MTDYSNRGFYGRLPMHMHDRIAIPNSGWQNKHEPESTGYYNRLFDGNYHRLPGLNDGLPDVIHAIEYGVMLKEVGEWKGYLPNRIMVSEVNALQMRVDFISERHMVDCQREKFLKNWTCGSHKEKAETVNELSDQIVSDNLDDKGTVRRMKRLENENKHYKKQYEDYKKKYIGAGAKIKELNAEIERLKPFEPITVDPKLLSNKTDVTRRFATMDLM